MAAPLPALVLPAGHPGVPLPAIPQNPPTLHNLAVAHDYTQLGKCPRYKTGFIVTSCCVYNMLTSFCKGARPAWFQVWDATQFQPLRTAVNRIDRSVSRIDANLAILKAQTSNARRGNGGQVPYFIVPFPNGDDPTIAPHHLPPLHSVSDIDALSGPNRTKYLQGYSLPVVGSPAIRCRTIAQHIGYLGPLM
ncbi:hypothetical protein C8F01DRAFT_1086646 [Mycena amicta]|nr:hypothetical protein C8F01DRAFT_1086646 [Mycena amicta]